MDIRKWFCFDGHTYPSDEINIALNNMFCVYRKGLILHSGIHRSANIYEMMEKLERKNIDDYDADFMQWVKEDGIPFLRDLANIELPDNKELISHIRLHTRVIEDELDNEYPEELIDSLINIVEYLPMFIKKAREKAENMEASAYLKTVRKYVAYKYNDNLAYRDPVSANSELNKKNFVGQLPFHRLKDVAFTPSVSAASFSDDPNLSLSA